jgi:hypothetical protein
MAAAGYEHSPLSPAACGRLCRELDSLGCSRYRCRSQNRSSNHLLILKSLRPTPCALHLTNTFDEWQIIVGLRPSIQRKPFPSLEGLRNIRRLMATQNPKAANVKVEDLIDARLIRKLDENGYIDKVAAGYGLK